MFNMTVSLEEHHFMHEGRDCYYKIWVADIEYSKDPGSEITQETQHFNTRREGVLWAIRRMHEIFSI